MPIVDKQVYLAMLREKLDDYVSANTVRQIIADASETLSGFDIITLAPTSCEHNDSMQLIQAYLDALVIRGATPKTYDRYQYVLKRFYRDVDIPIRNVTKAHITNYIAAELKRGISKNTLKGQSGIYCRFFEWLWKEELIPKNPAANIDPMRAKAQPREAFTAEEIQILKEHVNDQKELAIIHFLLSTGCRVGELVTVKRNDINHKELKLNVTGKGEKTREVYIDKVTSMMIKRYLAKRTDDNEILFYNQKNKKAYTTNGIQEMMRRMSDRTGIHVYPHRFRYTFAQTCLNRGMALEEVSLLLGHAKIETTMTYLHADQKNTENSYRKYACM